MSERVNPVTAIDPVRLVVIRNPFDRRERDERLIAVPSAPTIEALVGEYLPAGVGEGVELVVSVNGAVVPREDWAARTITAGDQMVAMPVVHGGGKGILGAVLSIALMVVAPYAATALYAAMGGTFVMASAGLMISALSIGISLIGSSLIGALTAPDQPSLPGGSQSYDASPSYAWQPVTTQLPGGVVARAYGTVKLHGNIIAGYVQNIGDTGREQTAHLLIDLGLGPYSQLRDFRINGQPLNYYNGVTLVERRGHLNQDLIPAFDDTRLTRPVGAKVVNGAPITRNTIGDDFDALEIVVVFPQGLYYANDAGGMSPLSVRYSVEISDDSGATWRHVATTIRTESATVMTGQWAFGYWNETSFTLLEAGSSTPTDQYQGEYGSGGGYWQWISIPTTVYTTYDEDITTTGSSPTPIRKTYRADNLTRGIGYQVRVTNHSADQTSNRYSDDMYLAEINEVLYDDFQYPRTVLVGVRALATDQLSGGLQFDCIADAAIVRTWNGSAWASEFSANPAWVAWDVLTQPVFDNNLAVLRYDGLDPSRLDLPAFYAWAQWCDEPVPVAGGTEARCRFDGIFDTVATNWESALEVAAGARAVLLMRGTTVTVVWDRARTLPAQVFSTGNTLVESFRETFLPMQDRASAVEVEFLNRDDDHVRDKLTVVNAAVTEAAAQRVQFSNRGIRRASQAWREAMCRLKRNELLRRTAELGVDIDALACTVGDLIWVQDDVTRWGQGGRIVSGTTTTLVLDKSVTLDSGKSYDVVLRMADDTIVTRAITTAAGTVSSIAVGSAFPATPAAHDVWAIGETGRAVKPFVVIDIRRDGEQRATLSLIEYNATLYNVDLNTPTVPTANYAPTLLPAVRDLTITEVMERALDGTIMVHLDLSWTLVDADRAIVYVGGADVGESRDGRFRYYNVTSGETYTLQVRPQTLLGIQGAPAQWATITTTVVGKLAPPATVASLSIAGTVLSWPAVADIDLAGYQLRFHYGQNTDWGSATPMHIGLIMASPYDLITRPAGPVTLMLKAVDTSGNESLASANVATDLGDPPIANVVETVTFEPTFPGTLTDCSVVANELVADALDSLYGTDLQAFYGADTDPFYEASAFAAMTFESNELEVTAALAGSIATLDMTTQGTDLKVFYRFGGPGSLYGSGADSFYGADADPFFDAPGEWQAWPGQITVANDIYQLKLQIGAGAVQGKVSALSIIVDAPDMVESIDDLPIDAAGTAIPYTKPFTAIKNIVGQLQANGSGAITIEVNKTAPLAPTVKAYNSAHTAVSGATADFTLKGY